MKAIQNKWAWGLLAALCSLGAVAQTGAKITPFKTTADYENCVRSFRDEDCLISLEKLVQAKPKEAMSAGKLVRHKFNAPVALRFFEVAAKQNSKDFCKDEDVQLAVVAGLALPKDYPDAGRALKLFSGACYADQEAAVVKEVSGDAGNSYLKDNACPVLQKHGKAPASCQAASAAKSAEGVAERLPKVEKSQIKLGIIKVYRGPEGERVTMAPIQGGELFLVRFDGVSSAWDGKVLLHKRADRGNGNAEFWTENGGNRWNSIVSRNGMEVYVPGYKASNGFSVYYDEKLSQSADGKALVSAYQP